ncbi:hypothetical protein EMN47_07835 [Prolixibacteraceae bacterium JC049]|nr:hypothetical protein [Prolixibacteraceae bacterium JC049]
MINFLSKIFGVKSSKEAYYQKKLSKFHNLTNYYIYLRDLSKNKERVNTSVEIELVSSTNNAIYTLRDITKAFGKPAFRMDLYNRKNLQALLYKTYIGKHRATFELHFHNDKLYYYSYSFSMLNNAEKKAIADLIKRKYINTEIESIDRCFIQDTQGAQIFINDGVNFSIDYLLEPAIEFKKKAKVAMKDEESGKEVEEYFLSDDFFNRI